MITHEIDARKQSMQAEEVWSMVSKGIKICIATGKKIEELSLQDCAREDLLAKLIGRSGNLRAPTLRRGDTFFVGYNDALYELIAAR